MRTLHVPFALLRPAGAFIVCWLLAGVTPALAQITVTISQPVTGTLQPEALQIVAAVTSASEVTSVQAAVGTRTTALASAGSNTWSGTLNLEGLTRGPQQLVVTATNAAAQQAQATRDFIYDKRPVLTVTAPAGSVLGLPDVRVTASCTDDGPVCHITVVRENGPQLAAGEGSIDVIVRPPDGDQRLVIIATDSTGRTTEVTRRMTVVSSTKFVAAASFTGKILDISTDRALIYEDLAFPYTLRIVNRTNNSSELIWTAAAGDETVFGGYLTPGGALFTTRTPATTEILREWRAGALLDLGRTVFTELKVEGNWALYVNYPDPCCIAQPLILRDLVKGTNTSVGTSLQGDVAPDGRVVATGGATTPPYELFEFDQGPPETTTQLTNSAPDVNLFPITDGINVAFTRAASTFSTTASSILRTAGGDEVVLATGLHTATAIRSYQVAGGWAAFLRPGSGGSIQAWVRAPDGTERQLTSTGGFSQIDAVSETGEVIYRVYPPAAPNGIRYLARPDLPTVELGVNVGEPKWIAGSWFFVSDAHLIALEDMPSRSILSEGATGTFFTTDVSILNPHDRVVPVTIRYLRENAPEIVETRDLPALSRTTIEENSIPGLEATSVSTIIDAPSSYPVVAERLMTWDASAYGGHLGSAVDRPRPRWYFAEGAQGFFSTYFLLANSSAAEANVRFTFLMESGGPVIHETTVAPGSRTTIGAGDLAALVNQSFATIVDSNVPIVAERAMYFGASPLWFGGHGSAGVPEPAHRWFHAEGATGSLFDTFLLLANPHDTAVTVHVTYVTDGGVQIARTKTLPPLSRLTINIEFEAPELASVAVSTSVRSDTLPIVSERAMYWGTTGTGWREAHNSFGVTASGLKWGLAEGRVGGDRGYQTFVLVSNNTNDAATLNVTFIREDGVTVTRPYNVVANQRLTINATGEPQLADANFSTIVESTNGVPINVESAIYWNVNNVIWEGGANTVATPLP